jgi:hypothetical protein
MPDEPNGSFYIKRRLTKPVPRESYSLQFTLQLHIQQYLPITYKHTKAPEGAMAQWNVTEDQLIRGHRCLGT